MTTRRAFLKHTARILGGSAAAAVFPAYGQTGTKAQVFRFTVSGISPPDNPNSVLFKRYLDTLETASDGRLKFAWHPGNVLVPARQALDALSQGTIDMLYSNPGYYSGKVSLGNFTELPFFTSGYKGTMELFYNTEIHKLIDAEYREKTNTTVLQFRPFSNYMFIMSKNKPVRTLADVTGQKIRSAGGMSGDIIKALGGVPVQLVPGEFYQALQQGIIDGLLLPLYTLKSYKLGDLKPAVTQPGPGSMVGQYVWMNLDRWNKLPPDLQTVIKKTTAAEISGVDAFLKAEDQMSYDYAKETGTQVIELSAADKRLLTERSSGVIEAFERNEGPRGKKLIEILRSL